MLSLDEARDAIIIALDMGHDEALELCDKLEGKASWVKVGMTLFYACGPKVVDEMHERGLNVFLDLKLHDIPFQIEGAAEAASKVGADILSLHGLGGAEMAAGARKGVEKAAAERDGKRTQLVAISVLTSMDQDALASIGVADSVANEVARLASLATGAGADGIVCSPQEASQMRALLGDEALIVCPGVRPAGADIGDQKRISTPAAAVAAGASKLVVGRPITKAEDPVAAFDAIVAELMG
ncbi:MAG: orotidine-5'-phosphate decarboxylase [Coriobacteriales bacterium]|nr:orotidine-5'-phosphate decarboxylase [Coriobacteriales bacterium]